MDQPKDGPFRDILDGIADRFKRLPGAAWRDKLKLSLSITFLSLYFFLGYLFWQLLQLLSSGCFFCPYA